MLFHKIYLFVCFPVDKEQPRLISCPTNIIMKTRNQQEWVAWQEPVFEDNCGRYPKCSISIMPNRPNGAFFYSGTETQVTYTAMDPSFNINTDCRFTVKIKGNKFISPENKIK